MNETKQTARAAFMNVFPIVGSFYRPPAKAILAAIPVGATLELRPEPTNPVDPNAIAVWIKTTEIPKEAHKTLTFSGADCGFRIKPDKDTDEFRAETPDDFLTAILLSSEWHLGYIPAVEAKKFNLSNSVFGTFTIVNDKFHITIPAL